MSRYTNFKVNISEGQRDKIKKALQDGSGVSIKLSHNDLEGDDVLGLTKQQLNKIAKAYENGKGTTIKLTKTQLKYNAKIEGGFIGAILPFLATAGKFLLSSVLPSLATGALNGLGSAATSAIVNKISGSGALYIKKGEMMCKVRPAGSGLYLSPWQKGNSVTASGLYMKTGSGYASGEGLILGPNSPFRDIPILGMIL